MDIYDLEDLKRVVKLLFLHFVRSAKVPKSEDTEERAKQLGEDIDKIIGLIDEAIARQSATSLIPHSINYYKCKNCEQLIHKYIHKPKYCPSCGKPVKGG